MTDSQESWLEKIRENPGVNALELAQTQHDEIWGDDDTPERTRRIRALKGQLTKFAGAGWISQRGSDKKCHMTRSGLAALRQYDKAHGLRRIGKGLKGCWLVAFRKEQKQPIRVEHVEIVDKKTAKVTYVMLAGEDRGNRYRSTMNRRKIRVYRSKVEVILACLDV